MIPTTTVSRSVTFYSNSKKHHQFSNLYECKVTVDGKTFPSSEHAYQCLQKVDGSHEDWCIGGKYADWDYVLGVINEHRKVSAEHWKKKNMIGVLAIQVIRHPKTFGVKLLPPNHAMSISKERWLPILDAKFKGDLLSQLLKTSGILVEQDRKAKVRKGKWGGLVHNGVLYGPNIFGNMLTAFRDSKRPKRAAPDREPDIEEVGHTTLEQAVDARFKKARTEGRVVDLSDELMPQGWDTMSYYQRMLYANSHELTFEQIHNIDAPLWGKVENAVVTFAGSIESDHTGKTYGTRRRGFTKQDLVNIGKLYPGKAVLYSVPGPVDANVLIVKGWCINQMTCFQEITAIPEKYVDKHMWMYGKCREKKSRVNSNYADICQEGQMNHPDPAQRFPSLLRFGKHLQTMRDGLTYIGERTGVDTKNLYGEVNHYLISKTLQGIGEHMDKEREMVMGLCIGTMIRYLCFQAYKGAMPTGAKLKLELHPGDLYLMDINAKGTGSMMKPHVKHHATGGTGSEKYLRSVTMNRRRKLLKREGLNEFAQAIVDGQEIFADGNPTIY
jgi:hypothetical protein